MLRRSEVSNQREGPSDDHARAPRARGRSISTRLALLALLPLLGALAGLDVLFNLGYPAPEPPGWYLAPSLDALAILALAALAARRGRRLPTWVLASVGILVVAVRLLRLGDGITQRYFNRPLSLALDLPTTFELVRLLDATLPRAQLIAGVPLALGLLVGLAWLAARLVRAAERALAEPRARYLLAGLATATALASLALPAPPDGPARDRRWGAFGASVFPRLAREIAFALRLDDYRAARAAEIAATDAHLRALPHDLAKLGGADVLLFFIEAYGATVIDRPEQARLIAPVFQAAQARLERAGFTVATGLLDSRTYAGRSWLAHETLLTGVRADNRIADELAQAARPAGLAELIGRAGYRTVFAQPANRYRSVVRWAYGFDAVYSGWDFDYRGPGFRWANQPDQYTLDFMHRREVAPTPRRPLLLAYALQSSHAPWSDQPRLVEDWSRIGDGSIYQTLPAEHFDISWTTLASGGPAYVRSLAYDLELLADYLTRRLAGEALIIVLGDHQPVGEVTAFSPSYAVPIHVLSRRRALVEPFLARGYLPGMRPRRGSTPPAGMETFLPGLLVDFSASHAAAPP